MKKITTRKKEKSNANEVVEFKKRMLAWDNPVEYVNNMYGCHPIDSSVRRIAGFENPVELVNNIYGCHPDSNGVDYFSSVYGNL